MKTMTSHLRQVRILSLVSALLILEAGCDETARIPPGTTEAQVIEILGTPSEVYAERKAIEQRLSRSEDRQYCVPTVDRVLFYRRRIRECMAVGIDVKGRVVCVESYHCRQYDMIAIQR